MEKEKKPQNTSRRKFLQVGGSVAVGAVIAGVAGNKLWKMVTNPGELFYGEKNSRKTGNAAVRASALQTGWRQTGGFMTADVMTAFDVDEARQLIIAASEGAVSLYTPDGTRTFHFSLPAERGTVRDVAVNDGKIYLLHPTCIGVYDFTGKEVQMWKSCSDAADHCGIAVTRNAVFVTDASAKNICLYRHDGSMVRFIDSPKGFVVPSYSFAIAHFGDDVYCSNPGRHLVEHYSSEGEYVGSFGKTGIEEGAFCGCCNPVHIAFTPTGDLLTSEKGRPRISCYAPDGTFRSTLLDAAAMGGGNEAYDIKVLGTRLAVAEGRNVAFFQYEGNGKAVAGLCGSCTVPCPIKLG
jgi:hypothetical protein